MPDYDENTNKINIHDSTSRGNLILIEGLDLSGKTTLIQKLRNVIDNSVILSEPSKEKLNFGLNLKSGHALGQTLKTNLLSGVSFYDLITRNDLLIELIPNYSSNKIILLELLRYYLIMASRTKVISDAVVNLKNNKTVILDRSYLSTLVYQDILSTTNTINILEENKKLYKQIATSYNLPGYSSFYSPDLIIFLNINYDTYVNRLKKRTKNLELDYMDNDTFLTLRHRYLDKLEMLENRTNSICLSIDANIDELEVLRNVGMLIKEKLSLNLSF